MTVFEEKAIILCVCDDKAANNVEIEDEDTIDSMPAQHLVDKYFNLICSTDNQYIFYAE